MMILYDKLETEDQIVFEFHYVPLVSLVFFLSIATSLAPAGASTHRTIRVCGVLLLLWTIGVLPAWMELEKAMRNRPVMISGSKLSFAHPLRVVISKK